MATAPARVNGNQSQGFVEFIEDSRGDLVDLRFTCYSCAFGTDLESSLLWPAYDFSPDYDTCCEKCGTVIQRAFIQEVIDDDLADLLDSF